MIIPPGTRLKLDPQDEYTHTPEAVGNYNESMYFNAFDSERGVGIWVRLGNRPNEGHAELSCCVFLPDGRVGFMHQRPRIEGNAAMQAGGMHFEVLQPFESHRVSYEGELLMLDDPTVMADPKRAFASNPRQAARLSLMFTGASPMHGGEIVQLDGRPWPLDPQSSVFRGHLEQHMRAEGEVVVAGQVFPVQAVGFRDKSWGPRHWQSFYWYKWLPVSFGPDFGVMVALMGRRGQPPVVNGHVFDQGQLHPLRNVTISGTWDAQHYPKTITVKLEREDGVPTPDLVGQVRSVLPLRHKLTVPTDGAQFTRIVEALVDFSCGDRHTLGIAEYCDLMMEGGPISALLAS